MMEVLLLYMITHSNFSSVDTFHTKMEHGPNKNLLHQMSKKEVGSGHIADGNNGELVYMFIGKQLGPEYKFQARYRWFDGASWSDIKYLSDGKEDTWHTNVERRPDGTFFGWI